MFYKRILLIFFQVWNHLCVQLSTYLIALTTCSTITQSTCQQFIVADQHAIHLLYTVSIFFFLVNVLNVRLLI